MAGSYPDFKPEIKDWILKWYGPEASILDVGAGEGTYANLLGGLETYPKFDAVEAWASNVEEYGLRDKYRSVYIADIENLCYELEEYDLVIMGDILEHIAARTAQNVVEQILDRNNQLLVAVPFHYHQGMIEGNPYEVHKQTDLDPGVMLAHYPRLKALFENDRCGFYIGN